MDTVKAYKDKTDAGKEKMGAELKKLEAQFKETSADARIILINKIDELWEKIRTHT